MMQLQTRTTGEAVYLEAVGSLCAGEPTALLRRFSSQLVKRGVRMIVLDFDGVDDIDAAGIGVLLEMKEQTSQAGGQLVLKQVGHRIQQLLELCALTSVFRVSSVERLETGVPTDAPNPCDDHVSPPAQHPDSAVRVVLSPPR